MLSIRLAFRSTKLSAHVPFTAIDLVTRRHGSTGSLNGPAAGAGFKLWGNLESVGILRKSRSLDPGFGKPSTEKKAQKNTNGITANNAR